MTPSSQVLDDAFAKRPDLQSRIVETTAKAPALQSLFEDIAHYISNLQHGATQIPVRSQGEPQSKKRKLEADAIDTANWSKGTYHAFKDISFSIPQRKKLNLQVSKLSDQGIRAITPAGEVEVSVRWSKVQDVFCLPVPEKAQAQHNFCIFLEGRQGLDQEHILLTVPENAPKDGVLGSEITVQPGDTYRTLLRSAVNEALKPYKKHVIEPSEKEFSSQVVQAQRKGEKAYHVKAFRGAKEGFLFLLSRGILWGFKKPLEFFAFDTIDSVSYTSVLQRTFNLNVTVCASGDAELQEFEFSMIDQADFGGLDGYIKRHRLQDASMAEQRRAKKLNVNGAKGEDGAQDEEGQGGDLEKARKEAEDIEDEEDEDENFDPGSEGESEGSGSSSEEDGSAIANGADGDLIMEELGSEAENVDD